MMKTALRALIATVVLAVLTGICYPLAMNAGAGLLFRDKATGSLVTRDGKVVGSKLIGQVWEGPSWFYGRPSATATPYDAATSSGSNLGPLSQALADAIDARVESILELERPFRSGVHVGDIPVDLVTASGSGLDPHISPEAAHFQAGRIAAVRKIPVARVDKLIAENTSQKTLGILGRPRVNVLELNLALEDEHSLP